MRFFQLPPVCGAVMEAPGHSYTYFMLVILRGPTVPAPRDDGKSLGTFWLSPQRMLLAYGGRGQDCCSASYNAQNILMTKQRRTPNVNSVQDVTTPRFLPQP